MLSTFSLMSDVVYTWDLQRDELVLIRIIEWPQKGKKQAKVLASWCVQPQKPCVFIGPRTRSRRLVTVLYDIYQSSHQVLRISESALLVPYDDYEASARWHNRRIQPCLIPSWGVQVPIVG